MLLPDFARARHLTGAERPLCGALQKREGGNAGEEARRRRAHCPPSGRSKGTPHGDQRKPKGRGRGGPALDLCGAPEPKKARAPKAQGLPLLFFGEGAKAGGMPSRSDGRPCAKRAPPKAASECEAPPQKRQCALLAG